MSEPSKADTNKFNQNGLPTEKEINEWTKRSRTEGICGIVNCFNKPTKRCKKCINYYCQDHISSHLDLLQDGETKYYSLNDGLYG